MSHGPRRSHADVHLGLLVLALGASAACADTAGPAPDAGVADAEVVDAGPAGCAEITLETEAAAAYRAILDCVARTDVLDEAKAASLTAFVGAVEAHGGFPIRVEEGWAVVYVRTLRWDVDDDKKLEENFDLALRQPPLRVSGDWNAWDPAGIELVPAGAELYHAIIPAPTDPTARVAYKLIAKKTTGQDVWFSDPASRRFAFDLNGRLSLLQVGVGKPWLESIRDVHATMLDDTRSLYVWLPPGYEAGSARYPVLYMHDGNNVFDASQLRSSVVSWVVGPVIEAELAAGRIEAPIVVGIPNDSDRFDEYTHVPDDIGSGTLQGGRGDAYADFVVREVKPLVDARYRTRPDAASTAVLGSSLGGLISFHLGLLYPDVFGMIGGMSLTFGWGNIGASNETMIARYADARALAAHGQRFYLDSGGGPPASGSCPGGTGAQPGEDNYCETIAMRDTLVALGFDTFPVDPEAEHLSPDGVNIYHYLQAGAPHNETSWHQRFFRALRFFFGT